MRIARSSPDLEDNMNRGMRLGSLMSLMNQSSGSRAASSPLALPSGRYNNNRVYVARRARAAGVNYSNS